MSATAWSPNSGGIVLSNLNRVSQEFTATSGQTTFVLNITPFTVGAQNLEVFHNGEKVLPSAVTELTSGTSFSIAACTIGDKVEAVVFPGTSNSFTSLAAEAEASATAAAVSETNAADSAAVAASFSSGWQTANNIWSGLNNFSANGIDVSSLNGGQLAGTRNRFINGDMRISQEFGTSVISLPAGAAKYAIDQWLLYGTGATATFQQVNNSGPLESPWGSALQVNCAAGITSVELYQLLEASNSEDLVGDTVTLSGWIYQATGNTLNVTSYVYRANTIDNFSALTLDATLSCSPTTIPSGVWTKVICTGRLSASAHTGLRCRLILSGVLNSGVVLFSRFQFEAGTIATPFEFRDIASEFVRCQRYYETGSEPFSYIDGLSGITVAYGDVKFQVRKRTEPSIVCTSWQYYSAGVGTAFTPSSLLSYPESFRFQGTSLTTWRGWCGNGTWTANARL